MAGAYDLAAADYTQKVLQEEFGFKLEDETDIHWIG